MYEYNKLVHLSTVYKCEIIYRMRSIIIGNQKELLPQPVRDEIKFSRNTNS